MGSLPIDPCLLHVSYLTVEVLEVASCILLKTRERKEKKKKKFSTVPQNTPNNIMKVAFRDLCFSIV